MKSLIKASVLLFSLFVFSVTNAQESVKSTATKAEQTVQTKAQNNNTVRSNRTDAKETLDQPNTPGNQENSGQASKKGYDYYKAKSDLNAAGASSKAQDHNSSRSNKTSQNMEVNEESGSDKKPANQNSARSK